MAISEKSLENFFWGCSSVRDAFVDASKHFGP